MSERGHFRGGGRGGGRADSGSRPGRGGSRGGGHSNQQQQEKPKKENILDLTKYMDKAVTVKFNGGRESKASAAVTLDRWLICPSYWHTKGLRSINESGLG